MATISNGLSEIEFSTADCCLQVCSFYPLFLSFVDFFLAMKLKTIIRWILLFVNIDQDDISFFLLSFIHFFLWNYTQQNWLVKMNVFFMMNSISNCLVSNIAFFLWYSLNQKFENRFAIIVFSILFLLLTIFWSEIIPNNCLFSYVTNDRFEEQQQLETWLVILKMSSFIIWISDLRSFLDIKMV